jgi:hypothetical protein
MTEDSTAELENACAAHLEQIENLIHAMGEGMEAIATNSIDDLRSSIARQEELCVSLAAGSVFLDGLQDGAPEVYWPSSMRMLLEEISNRRTAVGHLCQEYSALLGNSIKTASMLSALYRYHTQSDSCARKHSLWEI